MTSAGADVSGRAEGRREGRVLSVSEARVSDVVGRLIEFWGFKRNMGRVWTLLYLSPEPLSADDLRRLLGLSTGAVSMTLSELARWESCERSGSRASVVISTPPRCSFGA